MPHGGQHFITSATQHQFVQHQGEDGFLNTESVTITLENLAELHGAKLGQFAAHARTNPT